MGIELKQPLLLLLLLPAGVFVYLFLRFSQGYQSLEKVVISMIRSIVFSLLIFALTLPQMVIRTNDLNVVFVVDVSASMMETEKEIYTWINNSIHEKNLTDQFAIVSVGKEANVEQSKRSNPELVQLDSDKENRTDTNLEQGIHLASSLLPNNSTGRIVVFTDGNETAGNMIEAAKLLNQQGIVLDYVPLGGHAGTDLAMRELTVPSTLYKGEIANIQTKITSNYPTNATVRIMLNNQELMTKEIDVKEGSNQFTFSHEVNDTGLYVYKADVIAEGDTFVENNSLSAISEVKGTPKTLIVQSEKDENYSLLHALQASGVSIDMIIPEQLSSSLSEYIRYESIIFNNVSSTTISDDKMELIEQAVKDFGTGFIMTGGENSFGLGGYFDTPIETILPVEMEVKGKQELPSLGLVIVLDRSGSMEGQKLSLAKEAAARSVELLREKDTLGFLAFDDRNWEIIPIGPLENKEEAMEKIRSVTVGGGTEIYPALERAVQMLSPLELQRKHIILLTDGQSHTNKDYYALLDEGKKTNITLSTVALGQDADKRLLESLAEYGAGRFYDVNDDTVIPSVLSRETAMVTRTYIEDNPFYPIVNFADDWKPLFDEGVPEMNAYIAVTPKSMSKVVLSSEKEDPVLTEWQYGLGRTVAFTSDTSGEWAGNWAQWERWPDFLNNMLSRTFPSFDSEPFTINVVKGDHDAIIQLTSAISNVTPIEATVISESGERIDSTTKIIAPGKYEMSMEQEPGLYFLQINQMTEDGSQKVSKTGFTIPYSDEYLLTGTNELLLQEAAEITGGSKLIEAKEAFAQLPQKQVKKQSIVQWLLLSAFLLFFIEIAIRRFGISTILSVFKFKRKATIKDKSKRLDFHALKQSTDRNSKTSDSNNEFVSMNKHVNQQAKNQNKEQNRINQIGAEQPNREENLQRLLQATKKKND